MRLSSDEETLLFRAAKRYNVPTSKLILLALAQSSDLQPSDYFNALVCLRKLAKDSRDAALIQEVNSLVRRIERSEAG